MSSGSVLLTTLLLVLLLRISIQASPKVVETKGLHVQSEPSKVATGLVSISFTVNLPNMARHSDQNDAQFQCPSFSPVEICNIFDSITNGRYEVTLPCDCAAQEMASRQVVIQHRPWCQSSPTVHVSTDWTDDHFSTINLVVPNEHLPVIQASNISMPELHLVTPAPLPEGDIWKDLPLVGSGKVEVVIFSVFGLAGFGLLIYFLQTRLKLFTCLWKSMCCIKKCCCTPPKTYRQTDVNHEPSQVPTPRRSRPRSVQFDIPLQESPSRALNYNGLSGSAFSIPSDEIQTSETWVA